MKRSPSCNRHLFRCIVDLRAEGKTWPQIKEILHRDKTRDGLSRALYRYANVSYPNPWIFPSLSDRIIDAIREGTTPPGTPEQIDSIRKRALAQGLLHHGTE